MVGAPAGQASPGLDYQPASGTVTFQPGQTSTTVAVVVQGDQLDEPDEYVVVRFGNPTNAVLGGFLGLGFVGITDDDPTPVVVPGSAAVVEGDTGTKVVQVPVTLSSGSAAEVTVAWSTVMVVGAPAGQASPGLDYQAASGTVTFAPGQTSATVAVVVEGDTVAEPDEYVVVLFGEPTNAVMGGFLGLGFVGITDDDA